MRKIFLFLAVVGITALSSCEGEQGPPGIAGPESEVFELRNVNFDFNDIDGFNIYRTLTPQILLSDNILIYRMSDLIDSNTPVWQLIPRTLFLTEGELDYDFDFSKEDFKIYAGGTFDLNTTPQFITNQTFRIVIIPGYLSNRKVIDKSNYNAVIQAYGINDSNPTIIN